MREIFKSHRDVSQPIYVRWTLSNSQLNNKELFQSDLSGKFLFYRMNVSILVFASITLKKIPYRHTLRSTFAHFFLMLYNFTTK